MLRIYGFVQRYDRTDIILNNIPATKPPLLRPSYLTLHAQHKPNPQPLFILSQQPLICPSPFPPSLPPSLTPSYPLHSSPPTSGATSGVAWVEDSLALHSSLPRINQEASQLNQLLSTPARIRSHDTIYISKFCCLSPLRTKFLDAKEIVLCGSSGYLLSTRGFPFLSKMMQWV